jgi:hypothetical protein
MGRLNNKKEENSESKKLILWFKRLGIGGFMFFLIKGLVWLAVFWGVLEFSSCS